MRSYEIKIEAGRSTGRAVVLDDSASPIPGTTIVAVPTGATYPDLRVYFDGPFPGGAGDYRNFPNVGPADVETIATRLVGDLDDPKRRALIAAIRTALGYSTTPKEREAIGR